MSTWWGKTTAPSGTVTTTTTNTVSPGEVVFVDNTFSTAVSPVQWTSAGVWSAPDAFEAISETDLKHEVFATPINTLVGLWLAKFGYKWLGDVDVAGDRFFSLAAIRLWKTGRIERYDLPGARKFRLIEL